MWALVCNPRLRCAGKECSPVATLRKQAIQNVVCERLNVRLGSCDFCGRVAQSLYIWKL